MGSGSAMVRVKRIYEPAEKSDGYRVLVDRLWPRGLTKEKAALGLWLKEIAPSNALRKWFHHEPRLWPEFRKRYRAELRKNPGALRQLKAILESEKTVTLLYGARDEEHNEAVVLREML